MDELMAAMVLSSLSCSPLLHSPAHSHTGRTGCSATSCASLAVALAVNVAVSASVNDCGEPSEDNGDHWGVCHGNGSPAPSPPMEEVTSSLATPPDEGMNVDLDQAPFDEPAVRKRRVSERCGRFPANETPPP